MPSIDRAVAAVLIPLMSLTSSAAAQMCEWQAVGDGVNTSALAMTTYNQGDGDRLVMGGIFQTADGNTVRGLTRWDGSHWNAIGTGFDGEVQSLTTFDDGTGEALYAGGFIFIGGGAFGNRVAKWDGSTWTGIGTQFNGKVYALQVFDDGTGPALYAAGAFTTISGSAAPYVAKWDGSAWSPIGNIGGPFASMRALEVFDDGTGPALYAGGQGFTIPGIEGDHRIARWDGNEWTPLAQGIDNSTVYSLHTYDDGTGEALYVGGSYIQQADRPGRILSKWTGDAWVSLPAEPDNTVFNLTTYDAGDGETLYAAGSLQMVGSQPTSFIAGWNGAAWQTFSGSNDIIWTAFGHDDGSGPALYAGGNFTEIGDAIPASRVARFACGSGSCAGDIADDFGTLPPAGGPDGLVSFGDFLALLGLIGPCPGGTPGCTGDIADDFGTLGGDGQVSFGDFLALLGLIGPCP